MQGYFLLCCHGPEPICCFFFFCNDTLGPEHAVLDDCDLYEYEKVRVICEDGEVTFSSGTPSFPRKECNGGRKGNGVGPGVGI